MQEELNEFERFEVWELVPRPDKVMVITLKWIYKVKLDELRGILKNKARLERILKSKRAKTSQNRQETKKTSTRERFEANFKSRIKTVVKKVKKRTKEKDHFALTMED
ncbi:hypothetical protein Tco_0207104 [Tanacetum coccineum]